VIEPVIEEPPLAMPNGVQGVTNASAAATVNPAPMNPISSVARPTPTAENITISAQPLRASPIQDIPVERPISGQVNMEGARRTEGVARAAYAPSAPAQAAVSPLASIATPSTATPAAPVRVVPPTPPLAPPTTPVSVSPVLPAEEKEEEEYITEEPE